MLKIVIFLPKTNSLFFLSFFLKNCFTIIFLIFLLENMYNTADQSIDDFANKDGIVVKKGLIAEFASINALYNETNA